MIAAVPAVGTSPVASQGVLSFSLLGVKKTLGFKQPGAAGALTPTSECFLLDLTPNLVVGEAAPRQWHVGQEAAVLLSCAIPPQSG